MENLLFLGVTILKHIRVQKSLASMLFYMLADILTVIQNAWIDQALDAFIYT